MIDERAHGGVMTYRSGNSFGGRLGDSMPDYDNVKVCELFFKIFI